MGIIRNPVAKKRLKRFAENRRAWYSLWILAILFVASLGAELLCNNIPLYIRFEGKSYVPLVRYYPESAFLEDGRDTRPNYKRLRNEPVFAENTANFMIFPLHPHGPYETVRADTIELDEEVTVRFMPLIRVGTVDVTPDWTVVRSEFFSFFADANPDALQGADLSEFFDFPDDLKQNIAARFGNRPAPRAEFRLSRGPMVFDVFLYHYVPRDKPPDTLRLVFREVPGESGTPGDHTQTAENGRLETKEAVFDQDLHQTVPLPGLWGDLDDEDRRMLESLVLERFANPVDDQRMVVGERQYNVSFLKDDLRFPYPPVKGHPLGIDSAGRDVLSRVVYGLRISLLFGFLLVGFTMMIGIVGGALQGYYGGKTDITAQRMIEIWSALPFLYVMILMGSIYGRSFTLLLIIYGLFNWIGISYYIRAEFLNLRRRPFVEAARCMGIPTRKIIFRHIMPNALVPVITFFPFLLVGAIGALAALDYLGFGLPPPTPSWGELIFQAQQYRWAWWLILYPALALFTVMLLGVFIGEGVRNAYDPRRYTRLE